MKKILLFLVSIFVMFSSVSVFSADLDVFDSGGDSIYICPGDECGLKEGVKLIEEGGINGVVTEGKASDYLQRIVVYLLGFLQLLAVVIIIYAGFNLLVATGDEEKAKKSKTIILYAVLGLVIVYLAGPITSFIMDVFSEAE